MRLKIDISALKMVGKDLVRPEGVMATRSGDVYAADRRGHISVVTPDGAQRVIGNLGGRPNGICLDSEDAVIVANIDLGQLQRLSPDGTHAVLVEQIGERRMGSPNFPFVDHRGRIWCSNSTDRADLQEALKDAQPDGCVFRIDDSTASVVADGLVFANGLTLDESERYLFVAETLACRISRFRVTSTGECVDREQYGPWMGARGQPDGIAFDTAGNLWVTLVNDSALGVIYPDQAFDVVLRAPGVLKRPSNVCFGGPHLRTIFVGSLEGSTVPSFEAPYPGMPLVHQL